MHRETKRYTVIAFLISLVIYFPSPTLTVYAGLTIVTTFFGAVIGNTVSALRSYDSSRAQYIRRFTALGGGIPFFLVVPLLLASLYSGSLFDNSHYPLETLQTLGWGLLFTITGTVFGAAVGRSGYRFRDRLGLHSRAGNLLYTLVIGFLTISLALLPGLFLIILGGGDLAYFPVGYRNTFTGDCISVDSDFVPWYWERDDSCGSGLYDSGPEAAVTQSCEALATKINRNYCNFYADEDDCTDINPQPSSTYQTPVNELRCNWKDRVDDDNDTFLNNVNTTVTVKGKTYDCLEENEITPVCPA